MVSMGIIDSTDRRPKKGSGLVPQYLSLCTFRVALPQMGFSGYSLARQIFDLWDCANPLLMGLPRKQCLYDSPAYYPSLGAIDQALLNRPGHRTGCPMARFHDDSARCFRTEYWKMAFNIQRGPACQGGLDKFGVVGVEKTGGPGGPDGWFCR